MVVFYDLVITMDQEIEQIWEARWSVGKVFYLINRYYTLFTAIFNDYVVFSPNISDEMCLHWFRWQGATGIITVATTEAILSLRLYALWALDKKVLAIIIASFSISLTVSAALVANGMAKISATSSAIPGLPFCTRTPPPNSFFRFWFPILVSETVLFALAAVRGIQTYRKLLGSFRKQPLLKVLIRDSFLYYLVVFATYLCSAIIFVTGTDTQMECVICFAVAMASVMGNRLCLNIRVLAQDSDIEDDSTQNPLSDLTFSHTLPCIKTVGDQAAQCDGRC